MLDGKGVQSDTLTFDVATAAIKGAREYQEDSLIANFPIGQNTGFAVLADGMGGHFSGNVASALVMSEAFAHLKMKEMLIDEGLVKIPDALHELAQAANDRIARHIEDDEETYGMGSTLLATVIRGNELHWLSIGDSPLLLYRDGALRQLNKDHSMAPQIDMMVAAGAMSAEKGRDHPDRNTLMSAVTGGEIAEIDCPDRPIHLLPGDILISSSDGLQFLTNAAIARTLKENQHAPAVAIANAFLTGLRILDNPDQDNTAFAVIKLGKGVADATELELADVPVLAVADGDDLEDDDLVAFEDDTPNLFEKPKDTSEQDKEPNEQASPVEEPADDGGSGARRVKIIKSQKLNFYRDPSNNQYPRKKRRHVRSRPSELRDNSEENAEAAETKTATDVETVITPPPTEESVAPPSDTPDERKAYWYRGQKYYKD